MALISANSASQSNSATIDRADSTASGGFPDRTRDALSGSSGAGRSEAGPSEATVASAHASQAWLEAEAEGRAASRAFEARGGLANVSTDIAEEPAARHARAGAVAAAQPSAMSTIDAESLAELEAVHGPAQRAAFPELNFGNISRMARPSFLGAITYLLTPSPAGGGRVEQPLGPDLRATGWGAETARQIERRIDGEWQPLDVPAQVGLDGLDIDRAALARELGTVPADLDAALGNAHLDAEALDPADRSAAAIARAAAGEGAQRDDACAPEGTIGQWELASRPGMREAARDYQRQIARTPDLPGGIMVEYRVTNEALGTTALFDGCAHWSPEQQLLEAKYGYGDLIEASKRYGFPLNAQFDATEEASRQSDAAGVSHHIEWHVSDPRSMAFFEGVVGRGAGTPNFSVHLTPAD